MSGYPRIMDTLTCHWPVERPADQKPSDDVAECLKREWLYSADVGNGWARIGLTPAGVVARDNFLASTVPTLPAPPEPESVALDPIWIFEAIAVGKAEILADIATGTVPATVASFSELHDYVDANGYGGLFDRPICGEVGLAEANKVIEALNAWLVAGRPGEKLTHVELPVGTRVLFAADVERFPFFIISRGVTATVTDSREGVVWMHVDQRVEGLSDNPEWEGDFQWDEAAWDEGDAPFVITSKGAGR